MTSKNIVIMGLAFLAVMVFGGPVMATTLGIKNVRPENLGKITFTVLLKRPAVYKIAVPYSTTKTLEFPTRPGPVVAAITGSSMTSSDVVLENPPGFPQYLPAIIGIDIVPGYQRLHRFMMVEISVVWSEDGTLNHDPRSMRTTSGRVETMMNVY